MYCFCVILWDNVQYCHTKFQRDLQRQRICFESSNCSPHSQTRCLMEVYVFFCEFRTLDRSENGMIDRFQNLKMIWKTWMYSYCLTILNYSPSLSLFSFSHYLIESFDPFIQVGVSQTHSLFINPLTCLSLAFSERSTPATQTTATSTSSSINQTEKID